MLLLFLFISPSEHIMYSVPFNMFTDHIITHSIFVPNCFVKTNTRHSNCMIIENMILVWLVWLVHLTNVLTPELCGSECIALSEPHRDAFQPVGNVYRVIYITCNIHIYNIYNTLYTYIFTLQQPTDPST